ncbi:MAG TPA: homocysteine S-methyltransferase family protein [Spirochaetota bacterium]|nr:homocysteine S-methyltransferase family protein [Spirochaetota bacterium]
MDFIQRLNGPRPLIVDGAMGTMIFQLLPGYRGCLELLALEHPDAVKEIHARYIAAGADIIETNTFGGSAIKLAEYGLAGRCREINARAAEIARAAAAGNGTLVAGSIGPTGQLLEPMGEAGVEAAYAAFAEQARALRDGGADLIIVETMNDLQEAKLALVAAREAAGLPVVCSMTFEENAKTVSGTDIHTGLATLSEHGAAAAGANCSMGPDGLVRLFERHIDRLRDLGIPLSVWANAGMPEFVDGVTRYRLTPEAFAETSARLAELGVSIIGGCCGTTPEHIAALAARLAGRSVPAPSHPRKYCFVTGRFGSVDLCALEGLLRIGERLNPSARKKFAEELRAGATAFLREHARAQEEEGAHVLDINVGTPGIDEPAALRGCITALSNIVRTPLMIDSDNPAVIEAGLLLYPGVAIVNSINGKQKSLEGMLPLVKRFGCFIVALCLDEDGVHRDAARRIAAGERLVERLNAEGIPDERIIVDALMLAESAEPGSAMETLRVIEHFHRRGLRTSLGVSNISFGLPQRKNINTVFLKMAMERGLSAAILNPAAAQVPPFYNADELLAYDFLTGRDPGAAAYIARFREPAAGTPSVDVMRTASAPGGLEAIYALVVDGNADDIEPAVRAALGEHRPDEIMDRGLIAALERVGELYNTGEYFLPQMIASANSMKKGFAVIKPLLSQAASERMGTVVICTVRGDVHDIGKNIVAMMLENHGFTVHDLGKDVPAEAIVDAVKRHNADILALSSLLTTTLGEMKTIADLVRAEALPVRLLVGGAVVTPEFAAQIGAAYGTDAVDGVAQAKALLAKSR